MIKSLKKIELYSDYSSHFW